MPMIIVRYVTPTPRPELRPRIAELARRLGAEMLGKMPEVTAVLVEEADPQGWFIGPKHPTDDGLSAFWMDFTMTAGTLGLTLTSTSSYDQIVGTSTGTFSLTGGTLDLEGVTAAAGNSYQVFSGFASTGNTVSGVGFTNYATGDGSTPSLSSTGLLTFIAPEQLPTDICSNNSCTITSTTALTSTVDLLRTGAASLSRSSPL